MLNNKTILYFDTGTSGYGGSFTSLSYNIKIFSSYFKKIYLVYLNESEIIDSIQIRNVTKIKLDDVLYRKKRTTTIKILNKLKRVIGNICPVLKPKLEFLLHSKTINEVEKRIDLDEIDLIHFNIDPLRDFFGYKLCLKYDIPAVFHLRVFHEEKLSKSKIKLLNSNKSNRFIAISNSIKDSWLKLDINTDMVITIPNFIELPEYKEKAVRPIDQKICKLLFVGRVEKNKGIDFLIEVFSALSNEYELYIVGDGNYLPDIKQKIAELDIQKRVHIEGFNEDPSSYMSFCDILVVPSIREPFGRVVIEGMANKIPVIATKVGGMIDIIEHNKDGLFVDYGDINELKKAIEILNKDKILSAYLVKNALFKVKTIYSESNYKERLLEIYKSTI